MQAPAPAPPRGNINYTDTAETEGMMGKQTTHLPQQPRRASSSISPSLRRFSSHPFESPRIPLNLSTPLQNHLLPHNHLPHLLRHLPTINHHPRPRPRHTPHLIPIQPIGLILLPAVPPLRIRTLKLSLPLRRLQHEFRAAPVLPLRPGFSCWCAPAAFREGTGDLLGGDGGRDGAAG